MDAEEEDRPTAVREAEFADACRAALDAAESVPPKLTKPPED